MRKKQKHILVRLEVSDARQERSTGSLSGRPAGGECNWTLVRQPSTCDLLKRQAGALSIIPAAIGPTDLSDQVEASCVRGGGVLQYVYVIIGHRLFLPLLFFTLLEVEVESSWAVYVHGSKDHFDQLTEIR